MWLKGLEAGSGLHRGTAAGSRSGPLGRGHGLTPVWGAELHMGLPQQELDAGSRFSVRPKKHQGRQGGQLEVSGAGGQGPSSSRQGGGQAGSTGAQQGQSEGRGVLATHDLTGQQSGKGLEGPAPCTLSRAGEDGVGLQGKQADAVQRHSQKCWPHLVRNYADEDMGQVPQGGGESGENVCSELTRETRTQEGGQEAAVLGTGVCKRLRLAPATLRR